MVCGINSLHRIFSLIFADVSVSGHKRLGRPRNHLIIPHSHSFHSPFRLLPAAMASNLLERCTTLDPDGLPFYNQFTNVFDEMGTGNLANHDFKETFDRVTDERGRFSYVNLSNQTNFTANLIGEIGSKQEGTWMAAYPKKNPPNLVRLFPPSLYHI
jgi:hypothetical protein